MKNLSYNCTILIPAFNDWQSLNKLLKELNNAYKKISGHIDIVIINDGSTQKTIISTKGLKKINKINVINLKKNLGSQIAIGLGLYKIYQRKIKGNILIIDSDGEDNPKKIPELLEVLNQNEQKIIVVSRKKRRENFFLRSLNALRLLFTFIFTGKYLNFGNFSCFKSDFLESIVKSKSLNLAYCATISNNFEIKKQPLEKKSRYFGKSKVSFGFLIKYSLRIISIFKHEVLKRSIIIIFIIWMIPKNHFLFILISLILLLFNLMIFHTNKSEKEIKYFLKFIKNISKVK